MPDLSVVVPAYLSANTIGECLDSLTRQSLARDRYEVIVVLNGPDDGTRDIVRRIADEQPELVILVDSPATSAGAARNDGVNRARGRWTTFVDSDDWVSRDYLELLLASAHPRRVAIAGLDDVLLDGTISEDTAVNRSITQKGSARFSVDVALSPSAINACKAIPTEWLQQTPYVEHLRSGEDVVLAGHLFAPYERRFTQFDATPALEGARYFRRLAPDSVSRQEEDLDFAVRQRLDVIAQLTRGDQRQRSDRALIVQRLIEGQLTFIQRFAAKHPDSWEAVTALIGEADIPGVSTHDIVRYGISDFALFTTADPASGAIVVAAGSAGAINKHAAMLGSLARHGQPVTLLYIRGKLSAGLGNKRNERISFLPRTIESLERAHPRSRPGKGARMVARKGLLAAHRFVPELLPLRVTSALAQRGDRPDDTASGGGLRLALDRAGEAILSSRGMTSPATDPLVELAVPVLRRTASLQAVSRDEALAARRASTLVRKSGRVSELSVFPALWGMVALRLMRSLRYAAARAVIDDARSLFARGPEWASSGLDAVAATLVLTTTDDDVDVPAVAERTLTAADEALGGNDLDAAVYLTTAAMELLFVRRRHTTVEQSPLIDTPEDYLRPLHSSAVGRALARATAPRPAPVRGPDSGSGTGRRFTVVPGAYPKFARAVTDALEPLGAVDLLDLAARERRFGNTGVEEVTIREQLLAGTGVPATLDATVRAALSADVVFVDWADKGLAWVTHNVPDGTRVIARMHGVDSLSLWLHTVDWSRVSDVIFPSDHLRRTTLAMLGERLATTRSHVVHNPVPVELFARTKLRGADKTLGMIGWAQRVKDPVWTLEVLSLLRRQDPEWRLLLIGPDFPARLSPVEQESAKAFRARALEDDVAAGIDYVGETSHVAEHARRIGWAISSSLRESFHIALLELAASGAVPVVRDWPLYARVGGAGTLFPTDWIVGSPEAAARRILDITAANSWSQQSEETKRIAATDFAGAQASEQLRAIVLDGN